MQICDLRNLFADRPPLQSLNRGQRTKSYRGRDKQYGPSRQAAWTIHHVQNHTMPGHSPPVSQAGRRIVSPLAFGLIGVGFPPTIKTGEFFWMFFHVFTIKAFAVFFSVPPVRGKGDGIFFWPVTPKTITTVLFPALLFFTL